MCACVWLCSYVCADGAEGESEAAKLISDATKVRGYVCDIVLCLPDGLMCVGAGWAEGEVVSYHW